MNPIKETIRPNWRPSIIENDQWLMGDACLPTQPLRPEGQWIDIFPIGERQNKNGLETQNCTNYSLLNCVETLGRFHKFPSFQDNLSERERGIRSKTTPFGNTLQNTSESLRKQGVSPEAFLPFSEKITTWQQYYSPNPIPFDLWKISESWNRKYEYNHDWVFLPGDSLEVKRTKMMEALKYSPLTVAGHAWSRHADGLYYSDGNPNHAFDIGGYVEGSYWLAFDSYPDENGSFIKKLDWNFNFSEAKRHSLNKRAGGENAPEPTRLEYCKYLISWYINEIFR